MIKSNHTWSIDFMIDTLISSRRFRTRNVIDDYNREALAIEAAPSIAGLRLTSMLNKMDDAISRFEMRGV